MQVEQLAADGQGSCCTPAAIPSAWRKNSQTVSSISQEHTPYKTRTVEVVRTGVLLVFIGKSITIFDQMSAQGAHLILRPIGEALI